MVKTYEPFERGPHPVGVSSSSWGDTDRGCSLDVEIWYPAAETHAGQDFDAATQDQFVVPGLSGEEGLTASQSAVRDAEALGGKRHAVLRGRLRARLGWLSRTFPPASSAGSVCLS